MFTLDVVIATYSPEGIKRVEKMLPSFQSGVRYIISWQEHANTPIPETLQRQDVSIFRMEGKGLSRNRNNAILNSDADLIYISDDDLEILPGALSKIIKRFEENPDTDIATFKMKEEGRKIYPGHQTDLTFYLPKGYHIASCQIAFKRKLFDEIQFDTRFGINSGEFEVGEDELFHLTARKKGYKCRFFPDIIASHPHEATGGRKINNPRILWGIGAVITKSYPKSFMIRLPIKAYRLNKSGKYKFFPALRHLIIGAIKSMVVKI